MEETMITITAVDERGIKARLGITEKSISWDDLDTLSRIDPLAPQEDQDIAREYSELRDRARALVAHNRALPLRATAEHDGSGVWWVARLRDVAGQTGWIPRDSDQGGTHAQHAPAMQEARERAEAARKQGYRVQCG